MIQAIANALAKFIVKNDDTADYEVLAYGYGLIVNGVVTNVIIIVSALIFGVIVEMLIALGVFMTMRLIIGGVHANSRTLCFITNAGVLYFSIIFASVLNLNEITTIGALYLANLILLVLYAPSDTVDQPIVKRRMRRKILGIIFLSLFFSVSLFFDNIQIETNIMILVSTITCILLHPLVYQAYKCKKSI